MSTEERIIEVMGTTAHLVITDGNATLAERAVERLHELEARWSRFRADSEISRLNARPGIPVIVSDETYTLVERAVEGAAMTGGLFDPTLLPELRDAGYDRSFELIDVAGATGDAARQRPPTMRRSQSTRAPGRRSSNAIRLDPIVRSVQLQPGTEFDPGGIGKGLAADIVVDFLLRSGAAGALVSVGGDLRADGEAPEHRGWVVAVADPLEPDRVIDTVTLSKGAVASTWRTKRAWMRDDTLWHHLIDPRTGVPAVTGIAGVTVLSGLGWHAEVLAKAAFLAGADDAETVLTDHRAAGVMFLDDGSHRDLGDVAAYRGRAEHVRLLLSSDGTAKTSTRPAMAPAAVPGTTPGPG